MKKLDYANLQFEKDGWSSYSSYGLSKLLVLMFTRAFRHLNLTGSGSTGTTLINMDPGTVNTKMLLAGWGKCGIDVDEATDTFRLATEDQFANPSDVPKYYVGLKETHPTKQVGEEAECKKLYEYLSSLTEKYAGEK